jgi:hypothetical protein
VLVTQRDVMLFEQSAKALAPNVHRADGLMDVLAVEKTEDMHLLQLVKRCFQYYAQMPAMMMIPFNCSYRNKNEPTAIYPSFGYFHPRKEIKQM